MRRPMRPSKRNPHRRHQSPSKRPRNRSAYIRQRAHDDLDEGETRALRAVSTRYLHDSRLEASMTRHLMSAAVAVAAAVVSGGIASADMSRNVITAFGGELVIRKSDLPEGKNDKDTIAKIKSERLKDLS